ncbi:hypothetical protein VNI00_013115, partial [Paramarasmius palmivorus]
MAFNASSALFHQAQPQDYDQRYREFVDSYSVQQRQDESTPTAGQITPASDLSRLASWTGHAEDTVHSLFHTSSPATTPEQSDVPLTTSPSHNDTGNGKNENENKGGVVRLKREYLLAQIKQRDSVIESLLRQALYTPNEEPSSAPTDENPIKGASADAGQEELVRQVELSMDREKSALEDLKAILRDREYRNMVSQKGDLTRSLQNLLYPEKPFLPELQGIHEVHLQRLLVVPRTHQYQRYDRLVQSSKDIATEIAAYGMRGLFKFDMAVVKLCADQSLSIEEREEVIDEFVERANRFKEEADTVNTRFKILHDDFANFQGKFILLAQNKEKEAEKEIEQATKELKDLGDQLGGLVRRAFGCLGGGILFFGAAHAATYPLPAYSDSFFVGALIVLGVSMVVGLFLTVKMIAIPSDMNVKRRKIESLQKNVEEIRDSC